MGVGRGDLPAAKRRGTAVRECRKPGQPAGFAQGRQSGPGSRPARPQGREGRAHPVRRVAAAARARAGAGVLNVVDGCGRVARWRGRGRRQDTGLGEGARLESALTAAALASSALPAQAGIAECRQVVEHGNGVAGVVARASVVLGAVDLGAVEQRGQGDLDRVERVPDEPVAPLAAGRAAATLGPDQPAAGPGLELAHLIAGRLARLDHGRGFANAASSVIPAELGIGPQATGEVAAKKLRPCVEQCPALVQKRRPRVAPFDGRADRMRETRFHHRVVRVRSLRCPRAERRAPAVRRPRAGETADFMTPATVAADNEPAPACR